SGEARKHKPGGEGLPRETPGGWRDHAFAYLWRMAAKSATLSVMNRTFLLLVATVLVFVAGPCESEARTWTRASDGAKIEGEFVRMKDATTVFIRRDSGAVVEVPLAMLVAEDQAAIKELAA